MCISVTPARCLLSSSARVHICCRRSHLPASSASMLTDNPVFFFTLATLLLCCHRRHQTLQCNQDYGTYRPKVFWLLQPTVMVVTKSTHVCHNSVPCRQDLVPDSGCLPVVQCSLGQRMYYAMNIQQMLVLFQNLSQWQAYCALLRSWHCRSCSTAWDSSKQQTNASCTKTSLSASWNWLPPMTVLTSSSTQTPRLPLR